MSPSLVDIKNSSLCSCRELSGIEDHLDLAYPTANTESLQKVSATKENIARIWRGIGLNLQAQYTP
jgi:hypothetical protein